METECDDFPIFNDNFEHDFEKDEPDSFNDSIFLPNEFEEIQQIEHPESPKKTIKRNERRALRQARKDDFDYNAYIQEEMKNFDTNAMSETLRKHMIQKIRNRMSAQRSRLRQKSMQECMEKENEVLKNQNMALRKEVMTLKKENEQLRRKLARVENTEGSSVDEKSNSEISILTREKTNSQSSFPLSKTSVFLILAVVCAFIMPGAGPMENPAVKMGGIVPILTSTLPQTGKQLKTIETMCSDYCKNTKVLCDKELDRGAALHRLRQLNKISSMESVPGTEKQIELFDKVNAQKLICFDPQSPVETENIYRIIVNTRSQDRLNNEQVYLGQFEELAVE